MPLRDEILDWAQDRPEWQRDALRRLVQTPELTEEDLGELLELCIAPHGPTDTDQRPLPLAAEHFVDEAEEHRSVVLLEVAEVTNANAIRSDQPLVLAPQGITLIFAQNGAGKSGYIRLLKQVCRSRGQRPTALPNIYREPTGTPLSARLRYTVDGVERVCEWRAGTPAPEDLPLVSIFDHECASVYTDQRCDVAFLPLGLDLLPRLTAVCHNLQRRIDSEIASLRSSAVPDPTVPPATEAESILGMLDRADAHDLVDRAALFTDEFAARLQELQRQLGAEDPTRRAQEFEARAARFQAFVLRLDPQVTAVSDERIVALQEALETVRAAQVATRLASASALDSEPVPETGGDAWRTLWEAARRFAVAGTRDAETFPPTTGQYCPLCQQSLDDPAAERLRRFEQFVQSDVEDRLRTAEETLRERRQALEHAPPILSDSVLPDVELADRDLATAITMLEGAIANRRRAALAARSREELLDLPAVNGESVLERLRTLAAGLRDQADGLRRAVDPEGRAALTQERDELLGKKAIAEAKGQLLGEIERRSKLRKLEEARRSTVTTGVTRRNTELTERYLTQALAAEFSDALRDLRLEYLPVSVGGAPGERGTAYHQLSLAGATDDAITPGRVLSEGEHRCVALAAFLSEVETQPRSCTVILDDPVSSLDHDRLDVVARRLAAVATRRPVVVFTHDLGFALALQKHASDRGVDLAPSRLLRAGGDVGVVRTDLPWQGMTVSRRVGHMRQLQQQAAAAHRRQDYEDYERRAKEIYGFLREGWERGVEEVLLNGALQRYAPEVQTQKLRRLGSLTDAHLQTMERGMTKTSKFFRGHDAPAAVQDPVPPPEEVLEDIEELEKWRQEIQRLHQRR